MTRFLSFSLVLLACMSFMAVSTIDAQTGGTQPPAGNNPDRICVGPGAAGLRHVPAGTGSIYPHDGVGTEDAPVQANAEGECAEASTDVPTAVPTLIATPMPTVPVEGVQVTPTPTNVPATATATPEAPADTQPTSTPTTRPTRAPLIEPTPTLVPGEPEPVQVEPCYPGGPEPCGDKAFVG